MVSHSICKPDSVDSACVFNGGCWGKKWWLTLLAVACVYGFVYYPLVWKENKIWIQMRRDMCTLHKKYENDKK